VFKKLLYAPMIAAHPTGSLLERRYLQTPEFGEPGASTQLMPLVFWAWV
jgi:hypothetical protein